MIELIIAGILCIGCLFGAGLVFDPDCLDGLYGLIFLFIGFLFLILTITIAIDTVEYPIEYHENSIIALRRIEQIENDNGIKLNKGARRSIIKDTFDKNMKEN